MIGNALSTGEQHRLLRKATAAVALVALVLAVGGGTGTAAAQTDIGPNCPPIAILSSGSYEVPDRIDASTSGVCVGVAADDVVIEGNGKIINGTGDTGTVGLSVQSLNQEVSNITVRNLTITNFETGVNIKDADDVVLTNVNTNSTKTGVSIEDSTDVTVEGATISDTDTGVDVGASTDVTVRDNTIRSTPPIPIIIEPPFPIDPPPLPTLGKSSVGTQSNGGGPGIFLNETQNAVVEDNTVRDFEGEGIAVNVGLIPLGGSNEVSDNDLINNSQGISVATTGASTSPNQVVDNELRANDVGIFVLGFPPSPRNEVSGNELTDNGNGVLVLSEREDILDNTVVNSTAVGIGTESERVDIEGNFVNDSGDSGIWVQSGSLNNLTDNVVEDNGEAGIYLGGAAVSDVDNNTLVNNTATGTQTYGIWLSGANDNELRENTANRNNESGIYLNRTSTGNEIRDNTANNNGRQTGPPQLGTYGIWLEDGSNQNEIIDNEAFDNGIGGGTGTPSAGIYLGGNRPIGPADPVNNNTVVDNKAGSSPSGNQTYGIWLTGANENELTDNVAENNDEAGFYLEGTLGPTDSNTLVNNTARSSDYGIWLVNSFDNDVSESLVENNHEGIAVEQTLTPLSGGVETEYVQQTGNTFTDDVSRNNDWDFVVDSLDFSPISTSATSTSSFPVTNLSIGESTAPDTTLSFNADDVRLRSVDTPESNPANLENISRYFEAEVVSPSPDAFLNVSLSYDDSDVSGLNESTLELRRFDTTASGWQSVPGSEVDENGNVVSANLTTFSDFGAFGESSNLFTRPLPEFRPRGAPPANTQELNTTLYEDVNGDGDGINPSEAVNWWSDLVQRPNDYDYLTQAQVDALDWNEDGILSPADAVILWSEKVQKQSGN
jgi:parallel beta-helix repeat protein